MQGGYRSLMGFWMGGVSAPTTGSTPVLQASSYWGPMETGGGKPGYRSFLYFWLGGASK